MDYCLPTVYLDVPGFLIFVYASFVSCLLTFLSLVAVKSGNQGSLLVDLCGFAMAIQALIGLGIIIQNPTILNTLWKFKDQ